ncbi:MAG: LD-carboxypeptidase [Bacteroidota bacterium]|jgi:muramoyltetrapeptide carboxypeptidase
MTIIKPSRLHKGSIIGLVAPASTPSTEEKIEKGAAYLEQVGYRVKFGEHIRKLHGYLAGTDEERVADFNNMVRDEDVKAIFTIRGGYGTPRMLQMIDYRSLKQNPKIIVGYSDITALQLAIFCKIGLVTFSGPMTGTDMWKDFDPYTEEHFWRLLTSVKKIGELKNPIDEPLKILRHGKAHGRLLGGNLSLIACLMGTPFLPKMRSSILFLEDVEEAPYRVDRMLAQLFNAGVLHGLAGLVFGKFTDCTPSDPKEPHLTIEQVLEEYSAKIDCPVITNLQYGHIQQKLTIPIGLQATLDTMRNRITVVESAVI